VAQGFRAPNLYDLTNVGPIPSGIVVPNPSARPEKSWTYEAGLRVHAGGASAELVAYRTSITDFIDRVPGTFDGDTLLNGERVYIGANIGTARLWGLEAEAAHRVASLELRGSLLYTYGEQTLADGTVEPMSKIPPLSGTAEARWWGSRRTWWIAYQLGWATRQDRLSSRDLNDARIQEGGTPGFTAHAIVAGTTIAEPLTISAGFENVSDKLYRTHASGVDAPGRHVWVGVAVQAAP
jgi:outer membrane receptor protein involved in Fe transport